MSTSIYSTPASMPTLTSGSGTQGIDGADSGLTYLNIAALKAATGMSTGTTAYVRGYTSACDGGGGVFLYDATSVLTANNGTIIAPDSGAGRWLRDFAGPISVKYFGAKGDNSTDDVAAVKLALEAANSSTTVKHVHFPAGTYLFTPYGTDTSTTFKAAIVVYDGITLSGERGSTTLKVKDGTGAFHRFIGGSTSGNGASNFTMRDLIVDTNGASNGGTIAAGGGQQYAVRFNGSTLLNTRSNITIENCRFLYSGNNGLLITGCSDVTVRGCYMQFVRASGGSARDHYDTTACYIDGERVVIANNHFKATISDHADTAIQCTGHVHTVTGNSIDGYMFGITPTDLLLGATTGRTRRSSDMTISGNAISNCRCGIQLWSYGTITDGTTTDALRNVVVTGNVIDVAWYTWDFFAAHGIIVTQQSGVNGVYEGILIVGNTVRFEVPDSYPATATNSTGTGTTSFNQYYNAGIGIYGGSGTITGLTITGNHIENAPQHGIVIGNYLVSKTITGLVCTGNTLVNCGRNTQLNLGNRSYITIVDVLTNSELGGNTIIDTVNSVASKVYSIWAATSGDLDAATTRVFFSRPNRIIDVNGHLVHAVDRAEIGDGYASETVDIGNITAGAQTSERTVTCLGAATSDGVIVSTSAELDEGVIPIARVSAADTISWKLFNADGSDHNPASMTYYFHLIKPGSGAA